MKRKCPVAARAVVFLLVLAAGWAWPAYSQQGIITTFAGGGPNSPSALSADITPVSLAVDSSGDIFIAGFDMHQVFKVDLAGNFTVVAGTGIDSFTGDGGPAALANLSYPTGVAADARGDLFIADMGNCVVRRVDAATGIITTVAGTNHIGHGLACGFAGDGGPATSAVLYEPTAVAVDGQGNLFISDTTNRRIRRVDAVTGIITTVAGNGAQGPSGDNGPATSASLSTPGPIAVDAQGNLFIVDAYAVRRVDPATGIITDYAGNYNAGYSGDGGPAVDASLWVAEFDGYPAGGLAFDPQGNLLIADAMNERVRRVDAATGIITTVAGNGVGGYSGDGGAATSARLDFPNGLAVDGQGDIFIADYYSQHIRRVDASTQIITTVAGGGNGGDGGPATSATLVYPTAAVFDGSGNVFLADDSNNRIRRVDASTGNITTVAGNGFTGYSGDGGPATAASINPQVGQLAVDAKGNIYIGDLNNERVRRVDAVTGNITTAAGNGTYGYSGDGGPATSASLKYAKSVAVDGQGNLYIADGYNERVRRVDAATGIITTVAGNGTAGFSGDGGPATSASLYLYRFGGVGVDAQGNLFIADSGNNRVRRVDANTEIITTVAGNGTSGYGGDGGPALSAAIGLPNAVTIDARGNLFINGDGIIRRVDAVTGIITTVAGGPANFQGIGDGGPATSASILGSGGLAVDARGRLLIGDSLDNRIRIVPLPPFAALVPAALTFSADPVGKASLAQTVTLTNTGAVTMSISGIAVIGTNAGDYAVSNTCGGSLAAGANCTISVTFTPAATGASAATLTITDNAAGSPQSVALAGTGEPQDYGFSLTVASGSSTSASILPGQSASYSLSVTPLGGFNQTVALACTGAPSDATCKVTPAPVTLDGKDAQNVTVTVMTRAASKLPPVGPTGWPLPLWIVVAGLAGLLLAFKHRARLGTRHLSLVAGLAALLLFAALGASCGGGSSPGGGGVPGTQAGTYTLTVSGTYASGSTELKHKVTLTLTVK